MTSIEYTDAVTKIGPSQLPVHQIDPANDIYLPTIARATLKRKPIKRSVFSVIRSFDETFQKLDHQANLHQLVSRGAVGVAVPS